ATLAGGASSFFSLPLLPGLAGLLVSPGKGLLLFCPALLFLFAHVRHRFPDGRTRTLAACLGVSIVALMILYAKTDWRAGSSYGPRFMVDTVPILVWLLTPVVEALRRPALHAFLGLVGFGIAVQAIGAFCYPKGGSDDRNSVWDFRRPAFVIEARAGLMRPAFVDSLRKRLGAGLTENSP
ncbi:MAG TPA: hypothetical protein VLH41_04570, partial [Thermoanaerobaculia bacterium]|nr:hypothetical protein [Thermoanaerobaculia bacterium]